MASVDVAISLIQLIALFLPAWAVMVQIFSRSISSKRITENPRSIPLVAGAFAVAFLSLLQFALASVNLIDFFRQGGYLGSSSGLVTATELIAFGGATFVLLGMFVLVEVGFDTYQQNDFLHILGVAIAFVFAAAFAWTGSRWESIPMSARPIRLMVAIGLVYLADIAIIQYIYPRGDDEKPSSHTVEDAE